MCLVSSSLLSPLCSLATKSQQFFFAIPFHHNSLPWTSERTQRLKVLAAKPNDLSSIPRNYVEKGENRPLKVPLLPLHSSCGTCAHVCINTHQISVIEVILAMPAQRALRTKESSLLSNCFSMAIKAAKTNSSYLWFLQMGPERFSDCLQHLLFPSG